jgi:hypothetical protein
MSGENFRYFLLRRPKGFLKLIVPSFNFLSFRKVTEMRYEIKKELKLLIIFDEEEVVWLKDYIKNSLEGYKGDEPTYERNFRHTLLEILKDALEK